MFQRQKTKQTATIALLTLGVYNGIGVLSLKLHKHFMKTIV